MTSFSRQHHAPFHIYSDEQRYFLTARVTNYSKLFNNPDKLKMLEGVITEKLNLFETKPDAYVVLPNHYHLLFKLKRGKDLPKIIQQIHGKSSFLLKRMVPESQRYKSPIWENYWDRCVNSSRMWHYCLCYIIINPLKHGYAKGLNEWPYMDFKKWEGFEKDIVLHEMLNEHQRQYSSSYGRNKPL